METISHSTVTIYYCLLNNPFCVSISLAHFLVLNTLNLYFETPICTTTLVRIKPSGLTLPTLSRVEFNNTLPMFLSRVVRFPSVFSKIILWLVKLRMPLPNFTSEQSSSRTNFSPGFGSICGATFLSPNFGYIIIAVLHQIVVQRSRVKHLPDKMV